MKKLTAEEIQKQLIDIVSKFLKESESQFKRELTMDISLQRHLGVDSLGRAELFHRVEKAFQVTIPDSLLAEAETLKDIADYLLQSQGIERKPAKQKIITDHGDRPQVDPSSVGSLVELLLLYAEKAPDKAHIFFQHEDGSEEVITYGKLLENALRVSQGLRERGLREGETVAIMQPTHPNFFYIFFGTLLAGGVPVPIYPPFRTHMLEAYAKTEARILTSAEARFLVTFDKAEKLSKLLQNFVPSLKVVTTVDALIQPTGLKKFFHAKGSDHAFIQYTSGSTSDPKGVLLSHYNLLSNIRAYGKAVKACDKDVSVSWLPLYHDLGLIGMWLGSLYHGAPLILMTPFSFLNHPESWLWAIHNHRGTISGAPNFAYELCLKKVEPEMIEGLDLSSWRVAINGAEKVYPRTLDAFCEKFGPYGFRKSTMMPVYGLAETAVGLTLPPNLQRDYVIDKVDRKAFEENSIATVSDDKNALEYVGCGVPLEGHDIRIVDDNGKVLPERSVGNLQFTGPSTMQGYYNNPEATKRVFHDGWVDTGDLAYVDENKELYITGRRKDLIIKAGRNIYPAEIEELVGEVKGVRVGCVASFGSHDEVKGTEQLVVVAETREKDKEKLDVIRQNIHERIVVALDLPPDEIVLVTPQTVPKTSSGKLQRAGCKKMYEAGKLGRRKSPVWMQITKLASHSFLRKATDFVKTVFKSIFTAYVAIVTITTIIPVYLFMLFASNTASQRLAKAWSRFILLMAFCPISVSGKENLSKKKPVIYAANHASYLDAIIMLAILPIGTRFVGKKELLSAPILKTFMSRLNFLAVDRMDSTKGVQDAKYLEKVLAEGDSIMIFPEGTFGYAAGLRPFRLGAFKIATETSIAICPIALQGSRVILRDESLLMRPGKISITVSEPVIPEGTDWQHVTQMRTAVRAVIAKHCGEPSLDFIAAEKVAPGRQADRLQH